MARRRPAIERRSTLHQATVERTAHKANRPLIVFVAVLIAVALVSFAGGKLPELANMFGVSLSIESGGTRKATTRKQSPPPQSSRQTDGLALLHAAIRAENPTKVDAALGTLQVNELNRPLKGMTALMQAASGGNAQIVSALLTHGADPNARGSHQRTALQYAAEKDRREVARLLLDAGADINGVDNGGLTPLIMAADRNYFELASMLIERGANVNIQNIDGWTALMDAAEVGNLRLVNELLAAGARKQARHSNGSTALDFAKAGAHREVMRVLSERPNAPRRTPAAKPALKPSPQQPSQQATSPEPSSPASPPLDRQSLPTKKGERL